MGDKYKSKRATPQRGGTKAPPGPPEINPDSPVLLLQSPQFKRDGDKEIPEPFAEVARFFVESRLLQRDIKVQLEGVSNQLVLGTFIHPVSSVDLHLLILH